MKIACLLIENLPVQAEIQRNPQIAERPIILSVSAGSYRTVFDASPSLSGVFPDMPLGKALSYSRNVVSLQADPFHYQEIFRCVLSSLERYGVDFEIEKLGQVYVRLDNAAAIYGDEIGLADEILKAVPSHLNPKIGVATGKFPAELAAIMSKAGSITWVPDDLQDFLYPIPIDFLPCKWEIKSRLLSFGLKTFGDIISVGIGPLQAQFGPIGKMIWGMVNGINSKPFIPYEQEETIEESLTFTDPVTSLDAITIAIENLLGRAFNRSSMRGRFARICLIEGLMSGTTVWKSKTVFRDPAGNQKRASEIVKYTLARNTPSAPLEDVCLTLSGLTGAKGLQGSLFNEIRMKENLREALGRLKIKFGTEIPIYSIREMEPWSRLPERRQILVPYVP